MNTYLIVSETNYHTSLKLKELTSNIDNVITFNMNENTIDDVLSEASYFSMFDDKKCIIVKNSKIFQSSKKEDSKKIKEDIDKLLNYLNNENKNTILIFISNKNVDTRKKIYNILNSNNNVFIYNSMTKTDMKNELNKIVLNNNYKIDDNTLWYIINNSLSNFDICINELNKIFLYYNKPTYIKYDDVINLTSSYIEDNNFKLVESIISRDLNTSLKLLQDLRILKVEPSMILSLLYREFKLMLSIIIYENNHISYKDILSNLKIQEWQYNKIKNNIRLYNIKEIKEEIVKLSVLDYKLKSGLLNKDVVLIDYIMELNSLPIKIDII